MNLLSNFPEASAIVILVVGLLLARIAHDQTARLMQSIDRLLSRYTTVERKEASPHLVKIGQTVAYWIVVILVVFIALRVLESGQFANRLDSVFEFVPKAIEGILIIGIGHFLGVIARFLFSHLSQTVEPNALAPRIAHGIILIIAVVFGLQQMLVDITFITQLILLPLVILGISLALAFGLGSKQYIANLVAQSETDKFSLGDRIRVNNVEGEIIEKHGVTVRVETDEGIVSIPAAHFLESTVLLLRKVSDED